MKIDPHCKKPARKAIAAAAIALVLVPAQGMNLLQVYEAAWTTDATLRTARAVAEGARERLPQAKAQLLPNLSFSASRTRNQLSRLQDNPQAAAGISDIDYFSYNRTLQLRQPLLRQPLWINLTQSEHLVESAKFTLEVEEQNLGVRVAGAYLSALLAQDQIDLVLKQKSVTTTQLLAAQRALATGSGLRTDVDEAQARLDMNRFQELEARQNLDYTRRQLELIIDQPVGELARLSPPKLRLLPPDPATVEDWLTLAQANSPEIQASMAQLEAARLEADKAQSAHSPTLDAVLQVSQSGSENVTATSSSYATRSLGLQFNLPLYAGGATSSTVRQAVAGRTRAEEALEALRRDLHLRLYREFRGVSEGVNKVQALEQAVASAQQLVRSNRRTFEAGGRTLVDILNAEQQLQTAQRDLAQARYVYLISGVRLRALAGIDKLQSIAEVNQALDSDVSRP